jgi:hypothetical protein
MTTAQQSTNEIDLAAEGAWMVEQITPEEWVQLMAITGKSIEEMRAEPWTTMDIWLPLDPERERRGKEWVEHCMAEYA